MNNLIEIASKWYDPLVQRQNGNLSKQPRFTGQPAMSWLRWIRQGITDEPPYSANSCVRDTWLMQFWRKETLLAGIVNSVTLIDANRGWSITGGRNQVNRYTKMMHDAENGEGWRYFAKRASLSFWATDLGAVVENGREGEGGPLRAIYNVDSARCYLTGDPAAPLRYAPANGKPQDWQPADFFRVTSMPQTDEASNGLGFCAISRALNFAKLMYAVFEHDHESLGSKMMKGLLLLHNITEEQWVTAMEARQDKMTALEREYYGGVQVLTDMGEFPIDAKLVALSQLPAGFDQETMTNLLMYGYALCFGYDPREFWPVSQGSLGTGRETEAQSEKATTKGGGDFRLGFQERLQTELPDSIHFEFDERDDAGELAQAQVRQAKADLVQTMSELRETTGAVLSNEEIRVLLAQEGLIPEEWTIEEEESTATDEEALRKRLLDLPSIRRACERYETEPIVRYTWPAGKEIILWPSGSEALRPKVWYTGDNWKLTERDIQRANHQPAA